MRRILRRVLVWKLRWLARRVIKKYRPKIVAVTGSVGKTTTKELISAALEGHYRLRSAQGYNSEFGVPLTILNEKSAPSVRHWIGIFGRGMKLWLGKHDYPELLVLEMAADQPGDVKSLTRLAPPDVAVVTNVRNVHLANYPHADAIADEKAWLVRNLRKDGLAVLNFDDTKTRIMQRFAPGRVLYYGLTDESNIWAENIKVGRDGTTATVHLREGEQGEVRKWSLTTPLLGVHQLYGVLAAIAAAHALNIQPEQAVKSVAKVGPPPGRLRALPGKGSLTVLDDSYNASPQSTLASLEVLKRFPKPHRAVLGDMRELGEASADLHRMVGESLDWLDELVTVGPESEALAEAAKKAGLAAKRIRSVRLTPEAIPLAAEWRDGTVLVKGSQNTLYLERVSESFLRDPRDANLLTQRLKDPLHKRSLERYEQSAKTA